MAEETSVIKRERNLAEPGFAFLPQTYSELWSYAKEIASTDFVPKAFRGQPGAVLAAWQTGKEVGLPPMAALQSIAIINGRPSIHSAGYWALITSHPLCEWFKESPPDEALRQGYGECSIKRRGNPQVITRRFTMEEAKKADLIGKDNWQKYPGDMLQNRARHRCGDDAIPEACQGLLPADIARDISPEVESFKEPKAVEESDEPSRIEKPVRRRNKQDTKPNSVLAGNGAATEEPALSTQSNPVEHEQTAVQRAETFILGQPAGFFENTSGLKLLIKGMTNPEVEAVCVAFNRRKKELMG